MRQIKDFIIGEGLLRTIELHEFIWNAFNVNTKPRPLFLNCKKRLENHSTPQLLFRLKDRLEDQRKNNKKIGFQVNLKHEFFFKKYYVQIFEVFGIANVDTSAYFSSI